MVEEKIWDYAVNQKDYDPKSVFCHPDLLMEIPTASLYYRGLCGLSLKAARDYFGAVENLEKGNKRARISEDKALKMAQTYNTFICSIIKNSADWTLENGYRTIIANLGITLDGIMRNKVGDIAEQRIRTFVLEWIIDKGLLIEPPIDKEDIQDNLPSEFCLIDNVLMKFSSEPDISFWRVSEGENKLLVVVEIKGGTDPAGALERYGAATKSFQHALSQNTQCKNFFLAGVYTPELERRIMDDRLVEKYFDVVEIIENTNKRKEFFSELFHFTLHLKY